MIATSRHQEMWDLKEKPLFQFILVMPVHHPKAALPSASQLLRALFLQRPPLRASPVGPEHYLAIAILCRIC